MNVAIKLNEKKMYGAFGHNKHEKRYIDFNLTEKTLRQTSMRC